MSKTQNLTQTFAGYLFLVIIFLLPWQTRWIALPGKINHDPWEYGTISIYAIDIVILFFILLTISHLAKQKKINFSISHVLAFFILIVAFFSMQFASDNTIAIYWWIKLFEGVILFFLISQIKIKAKLLGIVFIITAALQSLLAIWQFSIQSVISSKWLGMSWQDPETLGVQVIEGPLGRVLRSYGSLPHPNILGGLLAIAIIICLLLYMQKQKNWHALLFAIALPIMATALWMTFSRQAWIGLSVILLIFITLIFITEKKFPAPLFIGMVYIALPIIVMTIIFPSLINARISANSNLEQKSINERQEYISQSREILQENWASGIGIGNYTAHLVQQDQAKNITNPGYVYQPVHNIYLLLFTELGIFGLAAWLLFIISLTVKSKLSSRFTIMWGLGIIALLIIGIFDHYLWSLHVGILLFWITAGLLEQSKLQNR